MVFSTNVTTDQSICNIYGGKVLCYVLYALAVRKACESAATDGMGGGE